MPSTTLRRRTVQTRTPLGRRITAQCALQGMTLRDLAVHLDVTPKTVSRYVQGKTQDAGLPLRQVLAHWLGLSLDELVAQEQHRD